VTVAELFASGRIVDIILALVVLETLFLITMYRRTGRGVAPAALLPNAFAGFCLLCALRAALVSAPGGWIDLCLIGAMAAHGVDLWHRWRS
jgi:hypothetical protein